MGQSSRRPIRSRSLEFRSKLIEGSGALIFAKKTARYLFLKRSNGSYPMTWGLPGGKSDPDERMDQALFREIKEELGGIINDAELILIERFVSTNNKFIYHTYFIAVEYEFVPDLNDEHIGYAWLPLTSAPRPLHPGLSRSFGSQSVLEKINYAEQHC